MASTSQHLKLLAAVNSQWLNSTIINANNTAAILVHSFVTSCIDYCNAVLAGVPKVITNKLQWALNAAARVISGTHKFDWGLSRLLYTYRATLAGCSWASYVQTRRRGVQLPAWSSASVPHRIVPTSRRCRIMATSPIRHPTAPGHIVSPAQLLWPMGFLCGWSVGLEFPARQLAESDYWQEQFKTISKDVSVCNLLMHSVH